METLVLTHTSEKGLRTEAVFLPVHGMNLASYKSGSVEIIDQATKKGFEERSSGLGPLIGPHFHRRKKELIPKIDQEFPQSAYCKEHGIEDFFSHGVARYVPWKYEKKESGFVAYLSGKDTWQGVTLADIEGQNFQMRMDALLNADGLHIDLSVVSDTDSIVGIHYYYRLPDGKGLIRANVKGKSDMEFPLDREVDMTFLPAPHPREGHITLETSEYILKTHYTCASQENSWQLYHPKDASFVCIEPLSAQDPRHPNLTVSAISIHLAIQAL